MARSLLILNITLLLLSQVNAQKTAFSWSLFTHATSLPGGTWAGAWHPGFDAGLQTRLREKENSRTFLHWKLGYYYHRLVHHGVQLYGEYNWSFNIYKRLGADMAGGLGYLHTFEDHEIFKLDKLGAYKRNGRLGKSHAMISVATGLHYRLPNSWQPFIHYRLRMVTPFVNEYVPLLPSTSLHFGTLVPIHNVPRQ